MFSGHVIPQRCYLHVGCMIYSRWLLPPTKWGCGRGYTGWRKFVRKETMPTQHTVWVPETNTNGRSYPGLSPSQLFSQPRKNARAFFAAVEKRASFFRVRSQHAIATPLSNLMSCGVLLSQHIAIRCQTDEDESRKSRKSSTPTSIYKACLCSRQLHQCAGCVHVVPLQRDLLPESPPAAS